VGHGKWNSNRPVVAVVGDTDFYRGLHRERDGFYDGLLCPHKPWLS